MTIEINTFNDADGNEVTVTFEYVRDNNGHLHPHILDVTKVENRHGVN